MTCQTRLDVGGHITLNTADRSADHVPGLLVVVVYWICRSLMLSSPFGACCPMHEKVEPMPLGDQQ